MNRVLTPELLDSLPPTSPEAVQSRSDLVRVNRIMENPAWFARNAPLLARRGERALELGAGDGALALSLRTAGLPTDALDRFPAPANWSAAALWHVTDLLAFEKWAAYPIVVGNLILHHLDAPALAALGAKLDRSARVLVFNEPLRHRRARLLWAIAAPLFGASRVTRHDGRVSIEAGFRADELPVALGLSADRWDYRISTTFLGAYRMIAIRRE
jgi:hypothetical protein